MAQKLNEHTVRTTFVRSSVEENDVTKFVIDSIMPYFPKESKVIGGYVDDSKQYWKANFHWEYLLRHLDKALKLDLDEKYVRCIKAIRTVLTKNSPNPGKGYTASKVMGMPKDSSSKDTALKRWKTIKQCKKDFKQVMNAAGILDGLSTKQKKVWLLAVAPVAKPGTSKHSTGYAVDIYGDNSRTVSISKELSASLVFPEGSHVHVEFANGVAGKSINTAVPKPDLPTVDQSDPFYTSDMCLMGPAELAEMKQATRNAVVTQDFAEEVSYLETIRDSLEDFLGETWW